MGFRQQLGAALSEAERMAALTEQQHLRLARFGYETATLDSFTQEEANTRLANWMRQRARWLKGFLATWLVHMRHPRQLLRDLDEALKSGGMKHSPNEKGWFEKAKEFFR